MSNSISFVGNIGKDAETRDAGKSTVTNFNVAHTVGLGERKQTIWTSCAMWGKQGERLVSHLVKGAKVFISGELSTREYEGKTYLQVEVKSFDFAGGKQEQAQQQEPQQSTGPDVPF